MTTNATRPHLIVDSAIPYLHGVLEPIAEVRYMAGESITHEACSQADALVIRTRTRCNRALLEGTPVRLIATATIGTDHIDSAYCQEAGIQVVNAPGCNAWGVVQWVISALVHIERRAPHALPECVVGIVGVGEIGQRLADTLSLFGIETLLCDPPREARGATGLHPLDDLMALCDIITFHVPLTTIDPHPTMHMANDNFFRHLRRRPYLLNASRGEVVDEYALFEALTRKQIRGYCLDVYESETDPAAPILEGAMLSTPHIAGYSIEGKLAGSQRVLKAIYDHFQLGECPTLTATDDGARRTLGGYSLYELADTYSIADDSKRLKAQPQGLERLRREYALRHDYRGVEWLNLRLRELAGSRP